MKLNKLYIYIEIPPHHHIYIYIATPKSACFFLYDLGNIYEKLHKTKNWQFIDFKSVPGSVEIFEARNSSCQAPSSDEPNEEGTSPAEQASCGWICLSFNVVSRTETTRRAPDWGHGDFWGLLSFDHLLFFFLFFFRRPFETADDSVNHSWAGRVGVDEVVVVYLCLDKAIDMLLLTYPITSHQIPENGVIFWGKSLNIPDFWVQEPLISIGSLSPHVFWK